MSADVAGYHSPLTRFASQRPRQLPQNALQEVIYCSHPDSGMPFPKQAHFYPHHQYHQVLPKNGDFVDMVAAAESVFAVLPRVLQSGCKYVAEGYAKAVNAYSILLLQRVQAL